jgi:hypothetical protein
MIGERRPGSKGFEPFARQIKGLIRRAKEPLEAVRNHARASRK